MAFEELEQVIVDLTSWCNAEHGRQTELAKRLGVSKLLASHWVNRRKTRTTPSFTGDSITTWAELTNPQSSPEITDGKCFAGCWHCMTFCLWGKGVEILVDPYTLSQSNQVRLMSSLFCDVGVRYPGAFAVTAAVS